MDTYTTPAPNPAAAQTRPVRRKSKELSGTLRCFDAVSGALTIERREGEFFTAQAGVEVRGKLEVGREYRYFGMSSSEGDWKTILDFKVYEVEIEDRDNTGLLESLQRIGEALGAEGIARIREMNPYLAENFPIKKP